MNGRQVAIVLWILGVAGCGAVPSYEGYQAQLDAFKGRNINAVVMELGPPTRTDPGAQGYQMYVWEQKSSAHTEKRIVERRSESGEQTYVVEGGQRIPLDCTTMLQTDAAGTIVGARSEGIACVGIMPSATLAPTAPAQGSAEPAATPEIEPVEGEAAPETNRAKQREARRSRR